MAARKSIKAKVETVVSQFVLEVPDGKGVLLVNVPVNIPAVKVGDEIEVAFKEDGFAFVTFKPAK